MSSKYGINIELYNEASSSFTINNTRAIAIIGDDIKVENTGLRLYSNIKQALESVGEGTIKDTLEDLQASGIESLIITSSFVKSNNTDKTQAQSEDINKCLESIDNLIIAEQELNQSPKFVLAPIYNNDKGIWEKLKGIGEKLRAIYTIEINETKENKIKEAINDFKDKRAIITYQKVTRLDEVVRPLGNFIVASYAKVMASSEYGFAQTYSNRIINGIIGIVDKVEFIQGQDCVADRLRDMGISLVIADNGLRSWGGESRDEDFTSLHSVAIFDTAIETILKAQKEAIDKKMSDVLKKVKDDLESFYRSLIANNVIIGFKVSVPNDINTNETINDGKIYIKHEVQATPLLKNITNKIYQVSSYGTQLIKEL